MDPEVTDNLRAEQIRSRFADYVTAISEDSAGLRIDAIPSATFEICLYLRDEMGFDYPADFRAMDTGEALIAWYQLYSVDSKVNATVRVELPREDPMLNSVVTIWPGMDWHERETFDLFGIRFPGPPDDGDPKRMRILLPEDWDGHPFRKDYEPIFSGDPTHGPQETN